MLRKLITGETISIDNHNRGVGVDIDDQSIHLHKRFNKGCKRFDRSEVLVNLNRDESPLRVDAKKGARANSIIKEITDAFKNEELRKQFVNDLIDQLHALAAYSVNFDYFTFDEASSDRKLTQAGADKILEIIKRVYHYFGGPDDELQSLQFDSAAGVLAHFVAYPKIGTRNTNLRSDLQEENFLPYRPKSYYVKADLRKVAFSLSTSREELTSGGEE